MWCSYYAILCCGSLFVSFPWLMSFDSQLGIFHHFILHSLLFAFCHWLISVTCFMVCCFKNDSESCFFFSFESLYVLLCILKLIVIMITYKILWVLFIVEGCTLIYNTYGCLHPHHLVSGWYLSNLRLFTKSSYL